MSCFYLDPYFWIEPVITRNRVIIPYQEPKFRRNKLYLSKHFHLAFQGGGAKGLAYVGSYRSIRQKRAPNQYSVKQEEAPIPIKSIQGSSAGGIIALAISTGIPEYELQKICYKMNDIPKNDRFLPEKDDIEDRFLSKKERIQSTDDFGNLITTETVK